MQMIKEQNCEELCWRGRRQEFLLPLNAPDTAILKHSLIMQSLDSDLAPPTKQLETNELFSTFLKVQRKSHICPWKVCEWLLCSGLFWSSCQLSVATPIVSWSGSPADNCMWLDWFKNRKTNKIVLNGVCLVEELFQNMRFKGKGDKLKKTKQNKKLPHRGHHFEGRYFPLGNNSFPLAVKYVLCCFIAKWCLAPCGLMDCSPPVSSIHGISQARTVEYWTGVSCIGKWFLFRWTSGEPMKSNLQTGSGLPPWLHIWELPGETDQSLTLRPHRRSVNLWRGTHASVFLKMSSGNLMCSHIWESLLLSLDEPWSSQWGPQSQDLQRPACDTC